MFAELNLTLQSASNIHLKPMRLAPRPLSELLTWGPQQGRAGDLKGKTHYSPGDLANQEVRPCLRDPSDPLEGAETKRKQKGTNGQHRVQHHKLYSAFSCSLDRKTPSCFSGDVGNQGRKGPILANLTFFFLNTCIYMA